MSTVKSLLLLASGGLVLGDVVEETMAMLQPKSVKHAHHQQETVNWHTQNDFNGNAPERPLKSANIRVDSVGEEGFVCAGQKSVWVVRPDDGDEVKQYPVLSFMHGIGSTGQTEHFYATLITSMASKGFVVVSAGTGDEPGSSGALPDFCKNADKDQLYALKWALEKSDPEVRKYIDPRKTGLVGHSAGATSTVLAASSADATRLHVKMALAINPHGLFNTDYQELVHPKVPVEFITGEDDTDNKGLAYDLYDLVGAGSKFIVEVSGSGHGDVCGGSRHLEKPYVTNLLDCMLNNNNDACLHVKGCSVADVDVVGCKHVGQ